MTPMIGLFGGLLARPCYRPKLHRLTGMAALITGVVLAIVWARMSLFVFLFLRDLYSASHLFLFFIVTVP